MSDGLIGAGTTFQRKADSSVNTFHDIGEVTKISGPALSKSSVEMTHMKSTARYREFKPGLRDAGDVTVEFNFTQAAYGQLLADYESNLTHFYRMVFPDTYASQWDIEAFTTDLPLDVPMDDKITCKVTFKITGQPDFTS